jgi:hypothetical protein
MQHIRRSEKYIILFWPKSGDRTLQYSDVDIFLILFFLYFFKSVIYTRINRYLVSDLFRIDSTLDLVSGIFLFVVYV